MPRPYVLIVDDDAFARFVLKECLEGEGYDVACAGNGREALDQLRGGKPPALILLDLSMPEMDGRTFLQRQRQNPALAGIPVVLLSGEPELDEIAAAYKAAGHFRKPFAYPRLIDAVNGLLENGQKGAEGT
jgi:CheY-like chemotaxis protein